jgi:4-hydroxybenzoate polyprenyltransferase
MRPKQWTKNVILFAALVFSRHTFDPWYLLRVIAAVAVFCLLSSSGYLFNDLLDVKADREHPSKKNRPIASGRLAASTAVVFLVLGMIVSIGASFAISTNFGYTSLGYLFVTLIYTFYVKHLVILDVMTIAAGFILRAVAGATAINVVISPWFLICTAFLALFLAMNKRFSELLLLEKSAGQHRRNLDEYSPQLLERMINVVAASAIMSYALYTFDVGGHADRPRWLMLTIPFVLYGLFRYQYLVYNHGEGGSPEQTLLSDRPTIINATLFGIMIVVVLHLGG